MRLRSCFLVHEHERGVVMMPTSEAGFSGVVQGNGTLAEVLRLLSADTTEEALVRALLKRHADADEAAVRADVARAVGELRAIGALEE